MDQIEARLEATRLALMDIAANHFWLLNLCEFMDTADAMMHLREWLDVNGMEVTVVEIDPDEGGFA